MPIQVKPMKNSLFLILFSTVVLTIASCTAPPKKGSPPNIIFILADDLGYGDLKSFNPESKIPTPHLNQLAEEGIIFTDAHTTSSVCTPSRYSIMTGSYPWRSRLPIGVLRGYSRTLINPQQQTIANLLKTKNYHAGQ